MVWKRSVFFPIQRKAVPMNVQAIVQLHSSHRLANNAQNSPSQASTVCETMNFQMFKLDLEKRSNCQHPLDHPKSKRIPKKIYFCFIDYTKAFTCVDHNKLWKTLKEKGIPDHLTCLLRNLYAGQEATVRTGQGTDYFQIGKAVHKDYILSLSLFSLYAEYIM